MIMITTTATATATKEHWIQLITFATETNARAVAAQQTDTHTAQRDAERHNTFSAC